MFVFDVDGTIFDTQYEILTALNSSLERYGITPVSQSESKKYIGPPFTQTLSLYKALDSDVIEKIVADFRMEYKNTIVNSKIYPNMLYVLKELRNSGELLGIATMKPYEQIETLLNYNHIHNLFCCIEATTPYQSDKAMMLKNIKAKFPDQKRYIMVGDTKGDLDAAMNAGFTFVFAGYGYGSIDDIMVHHIQDPLDILTAYTAQKVQLDRR